MGEFYIILLFFNFNVLQQDDVAGVKGQCCQQMLEINKEKIRIYFPELKYELEPELQPELEPEL